MLPSFKSDGPSGACLDPGGDQEALAVLPDTPTFHDTFTPKEVGATVAAGTPLRREGVSEEVAAAVLFLASEQSSFVTGACIDINGGTWMS